ncbi:hypothetical protein NDU88_003435 [Pleurodeles waltl]|uniref:Uncharacterized protein n=1 Tax=Pleurodeles waltl TaxID=8319 RepID=A0AAV7T4Y8_PLEWA|nr:hypothetical protein NDU88_003435 [Pleurodeles waltl]
MGTDQAWEDSEEAYQAVSEITIRAAGSRKSCGDGHTQDPPGASGLGSPKSVLVLPESVLLGGTEASVAGGVPVTTGEGPQKLGVYCWLQVALRAIIVGFCCRRAVAVRELLKRICGLRPSLGSYMLTGCSFFLIKGRPDTWLSGF